MSPFATYTVFNCGVTENASSQMLVTEFGIVALAKLLQPENA